jgi:hypothetical protein
MSLTDKVTINDVQKELDELETAYDTARKAALDAVTKPYQLKKRKLTNLIRAMEALGENEVDGD